MFSPFQEKPGPPSSPGHVGHAESLVPTGDKNAGPPPQGVSRFPQVRAYTLCHLCTIQSQIYYLCQNNKEDSKVETLQFSQLITKKLFGGSGGILQRRQALRTALIEKGLTGTKPKRHASDKTSGWTRGSYFCK